MHENILLYDYIAKLYTFDIKQKSSVMLLVIECHRQA